MAQTYQVDDTVTVCAVNVYCSGRSLTGKTPVIVEAEVGGAGTSTTSSPTIAAGETNVVAVNIELVVPAGATWGSGTWTIKINITTANSSVTWTEVYVCRVSSGCVSQASIGSATGLGISLGTTGVKSANVAGAAQTPAAGDKVIVVLVFTGAGHGSDSFAFDHSAGNSEVLSPFTSGATAVVVADSGAGTDVVQGPSVQLTIADSGTGTEATPGIQAAVPVADAGSGADVVSSSLSAAVPDAGSGTDVPAVAALVPMADQGSGADVLVVGVASLLADAGGGSDVASSSVGIGVVDAGIGNDAGVLEVVVPVLDSGTGTDRPVIGVALAVADAGVGTDVPAVGAIVAVVDDGQGTEQVLAGTLIQLADSGVG